MTPHEPMGEMGWDPTDAGYTPVLPITYGRFLDPLDMRLLTDRDSGRETWMLLRPFRYESTLLGKVVDVPAGFVHDGESVPLQLRSFSGVPSTRAGVVHDYGVKIHAPDDEELWAQVYREAMLTDGVHVVTADIRYGSVSYYGHSAWESGPSRLRVVVG